MSIFSLVKAGVLVRNQCTDLPAMRRAGVTADRLGYDSLRTWGRGYATGAARRRLDDAGASPGWSRIAWVIASGPSEGPPDTR